MVMKPSGTPKQWACSACNWQQGAVFQSDVLPPRPHACPKCGKEVVIKEASLLNRLRGIFR